MKCPKCQFENPKGAKFCMDCGAFLELGLTCKRCGSSYPKGGKFCTECGNRLIPQLQPTIDVLSFNEKLNKIQRYLPRGLTEKILSQRHKIEGERKNVTIMFCDMKGFTPLTEMLGPDETFFLMSEVFDLLIHKVHDFEGTVNEMRGDGILAVFGAPIALEDAPQRAIQSALAIQKEMIQFSEKVSRERNIIKISIRIGINSGTVVVGTVGNDLRVQFTAVGDTINIAARMEQIAEPGTTYVSEETFRLTEGFFRFEALGEKQIKGKKKPIRVYRVIASSNRRTRFDVSAERGLTRFVGRQRDLDVMLYALDRAQAGQGQAVFIVGEAGSGKSRLLYEFRKAVANEDVSFLEGRCFSYGKGVAYHLIIDLLKSAFGIEDEDSDIEMTEKVKRGLAFLEVEENSTLPYLLKLLSVKYSGLTGWSMSPAAMKDRILGSLKKVTLKGAAKRSLVLALEDLHLMDRSSEEAVRFLLGCIPGARILLIYTYRPEFVSNWGNRSFYNQLTLNPLSDRESLAMVLHMLESDEVANDLQDFILEKTDGVPFFIEEFVRALVDMQFISRTKGTYHLVKNIHLMSIPSNVKDVIMARVDSLPSASKEVLQAGSVIDREFSYDLIKTVTDFSEKELISQISVLKDADLLYERWIFPQSKYVFKHAVTREVLYDSILINRKKLLHRKIGKAIEMLYQDNLDVYHSVLAHHFMISEDYQASADYSKRTYEQARIKASLETAISHAQKRISALEHLTPTPEVQRQIIETRTYQGLTLCIPGNFGEAKEAIDPIVDLDLPNIDKRSQAKIYFILGSHQYMIEEDFTPALKFLQKSMKLAEEAADLFTATQASIFYGLALCWRCQFERGAEHLMNALRTNEAAQMHWGISFLNSNLSYYVYNYQGKVAEGFATSLKALEIAEQSGDIFSRAVAYVCHGISYFYKGFFEEAEEHLLKGLKLCKRIRLLSFSSIAQQALGYVCYEEGEYLKSQRHHWKAILERKQSGLLPSCVNLNEMALAKSALAAEKTDPDMESLLKLHKTNRLKLYHGTLTRHLAQILHQFGKEHISEAEFWIRKAILEHEKLVMNWDLASDYVLLGQILNSQGRKVESKDYLKKALSLFKQCGADGWYSRIMAGCEKSQSTNIHTYLL